MNDELREQLADEQHEIWTHWMQYLFQCSHAIGTTGHVMIPAEFVERWKRQMGTPYSELSEKEKESDRRQADKVLSVLRSAQSCGTTCP